MGMDISGKAPASEAGKYFRNNYWWWRPMARYIKAMHPDLYALCTHWESNDGDGLNLEDAKELGNRLLDDVATGRAAAYAETRDDDLPHSGPGGSYPFSVDNVREFGEFARDSGGFEI
jgi:hypothetical protein